MVFNRNEKVTLTDATQSLYCNLWHHNLTSTLDWFRINFASLVQNKELAIVLSKKKRGEDEPPEIRVVKAIMRSGCYD
jgi:hypothetical protein